MSFDRPGFTFLLLLAAGGTACGGDSSRKAQAQATNGASAEWSNACPGLETREPNASGQRPAFPGQTRACGVKSNVAFDVAVLAKGLEHPWAVEPLPGGGLLVTEKPGRLRIVSAAGELGAADRRPARRSMRAARAACSTSR